MSDEEKKMVMTCAVHKKAFKKGNWSFLESIIKNMTDKKVEIYESDYVVHFRRELDDGEMPNVLRGS